MVNKRFEVANTLDLVNNENLHRVSYHVNAWMPLGEGSRKYWWNRMFDTASYPIS